MPKLRIGFSTDFNLKDEQVGIGTEFPTARLEVRGNILAENILDSGGISTITRYDGFLNPDLILTERTTSLSITDKGNLNTLSGEIKIEGEVTVEERTPLTGGRLDSLTVTGKFDLPQGGSEDREDTPEKGSTRFNEDLGQLEFYTGLEWRTVGSLSRGSFAGRAYLAGGARRNNVPGSYSQIESFSLITGGTTTDFGQLENGNGYFSGCASSVRGIFAGGSPYSSNLQYITLSTKGTSVDYGQMYVHRASYQGTLSSSTRGIVPGGYIAPAYRTEIDYFEIATTGGAQDFGDLYSDGMIGVGGMASPTRGVYAGGYIAPTSPLSPAPTEIGYLTIASKGNSLKFGDSSNKHAYTFSGSNQTRGIFGGGTGVFPAQVVIKSLETVEMASTGNSYNFGDLTVQRRLGAASSSNTRIVCFGGTKSVPGSGNDSSDVDTVQFSSLGNAVDFGDISQTNIGFAECSDSHGGLGGF